MSLVGVIVVKRMASQLSGCRSCEVNTMHGWCHVKDAGRSSGAICHHSVCQRSLVTHTCLAVITGDVVSNKHGQMFVQEAAGHSKWPS